MPPTHITVQASEAWPVVVAGLSSAIIVGLISVWVARKQRRADDERQKEWLGQDRLMRENEIGAASKRLGRQLAEDRDLRAQQMQADSVRLDRQLAHDRDMRDLQHLRETLGPIIADAIDWGAFTSLHFKLKGDDVTPIDAEKWTSEIVPLVNDVANVSERLRRGSRTLVVLAGPAAPIALTLKEVGNDGDTLVNVARKRAEEGATTPEIQAALDGLLLQYGYDHARFVEAANEAVRWGEGSARSSA